MAIIEQRTGREVPIRDRNNSFVYIYAVDLNKSGIKVTQKLGMRKKKKIPGRESKTRHPQTVAHMLFQLCI